MPEGSRTRAGETDRVHTSTETDHATRPALLPEADEGDIRQEVNGIAGLALEQGRAFLDTARANAIDYADQRKGDAAEQVSLLANTLRSSNESFADRPHIQAFVDTAADGLEQLADTIRARSFGEIYDDVEQMVRTYPVAVASATAVAGFLFARFVKASGEQIQRASADQQRRRSQTAVSTSRQARVTPKPSAPAAEI